MSNDNPPPPPPPPGEDPAEQPASPPPPPPADPSPYGQPPGQPQGQPQYGQPDYGQQPPPPPYGQQPPAYGQPPGYPPVPPPGAPGGYGAYGQPQQTSPLAITSLVLGIVSLLCCTIFVLGIGAVVTGFIARKQIAERQGQLKGGGMATAGLVLGIVSIVLAVVVWVLNLTGAMDNSFYLDGNV